MSLFSTAIGGEGSAGAPNLNLQIFELKANFRAHVMSNG